MLCVRTLFHAFKFVDILYSLAPSPAPHSITTVLFIAWAHCTFIRAFYAFFFPFFFVSMTFFSRSNGIRFNACLSWYLCFYIHIIFSHLWVRHGHNTQFIEPNILGNKNNNDRSNSGSGEPEKKSKV